MSATTPPLLVARATAPRRVSDHAVRALARVHARRHLWSPGAIPAIGATLMIALETGGLDWSGGTYSQLPLYFTPLATWAFFSCLVAAGRDRRVDLPPLAEEAPVDVTSRTVAQLRGALVFPLLAVVGVAVVEVASWIEGGYWLGTYPWRTDSAHHTVPELLQPVALVALAAAAGVAAGRRFRHRTPVGVVMALFVFLQTGLWWAFQFVPLVTVTLAQLQPMQRYVAPAGTAVQDLPANLYLLGPDDNQDVWTQHYIDQPLVAAHVLYLVGLVTVLVANALRPRGAEAGGPTLVGRRLRVVGWAAVVVALVLQFWALGWVFTPGGTGEGQIP